MKFRYGPGGSLTCDISIEDITQNLDTETASFYHGQYFIAESMTREAARKIAAALGGMLEEG